jgi:hypothetical protein
MPKVPAVLVTLSLLILGLVILFSGMPGTEMKISFTEAQLQEKLTEALAKYPGEKFKVESVTVKLNANSATVSAHASGSYLTKDVSAELTLTGQPKYRSGSFYFEPTEPPRVVVKVVSTPKAEPENPGAFSNTKKLLGEKLKEVIANNDLTEVIDTFKQELTAWFVGKAETVVVEAFKRHPLYTLPHDGKGMVVRAVLTDVTVVDNTLVVTLSLVTLGWLLALGFVLVIVMPPLGIYFFTRRKTETAQSSM